jgi:hypothetical protein
MRAAGYLDGEKKGEQDALHWGKLPHLIDM